jgi:RIP metalloprotease RseP
MSAKPTVALTALPEEQAKESPAVAAGIKPGDLLLSVNGQKPENLPEVAQEAGAAGEPLSLVVLREQDGKPSERLTIQVTPELAAGPAFLAGIGRGTQNRPDGPEDATAPPRTYMIGVQMAQGPHLVTNVEPGGPAAEAGIEEGDLLGILYPPAVTDLDELDEVVMHPWRNGKPDLANPLHVAVDRNSELAIHFEQSVTQLAKAGLVGAVPMAVEETTRLLGTTYWTLYALITNKVSFKAMSGPVGIMQTMYKSSGPGFGFYLWFLALISINLAVINLLPIPVLDGGHLMFLAIEGIRRKPLSQRVQEMALWSGIALLLTMILIVTWNDVMRLFI